MQVYNIPINSDQKEITRHGSSDFPVAVYETELKKNVLGYVAWHWHEEIQFCYVISGRVCFQVNNHQKILGENQGIFIASNVLHMAKSWDNTDGSYVCINLNPILLCGYPGSVIMRRYIHPVAAHKNTPCLCFYGENEWEADVITSLIKLYEMYIKKPEGYELDMVAQLLAIWKKLYINYKEQEEEDSFVTGRDNERIKQVLCYIHEHYSEKVTLQQIADHVNVSRNECCRFFKKYMGCSIFSYLTDYRILKSTELLLETDWPVSVIAAESGFNGASYYIEQFRRKKQITPKEYRNVRLR